MTERQRMTSPIGAARLAVAGVILAGGALAMAGQAAADPDVLYPTPAPGPPVVEPNDASPVDAPVPPPAGPPAVPEIQNPRYGSGSGSGPLGFLRDVLHQARDPYGTNGGSDELTPGGGAAPPPGAGPAPALPPGFVSLNAPGSETVSPATGPAQGGPALPPGYYPLNGPAPPDDNSPPPSDPATDLPVPPTP